MADLVPTSEWSGVPQIETNTVALGGPGGPANLQAQALLNRTQVLDEQKAPKASPIFTGTPEAPLAPAFDISNKLANTAFVNREKGNLNGWSVISTTTVLTANHCGKPLQLAGSGSYDVTLPPPNTVGNGAMIYFYYVNPGVTATIRNGAGVAMFTMKHKTTAVFCSNGFDQWFLIDGTKADWLNNDLTMFSGPYGNGWWAYYKESSEIVRCTGLNHVVGSLAGVEITLPITFSLFFNVSAIFHGAVGSTGDGVNGPGIGATGGSSGSKIAIFHNLTGQALWVKWEVSGYVA